MLWEQDSKGLIERMEKFLEIADRHKIGVMFVLFDAVWDPFPKLGKQREPKQGLHNSGWVQSPSQDVLKDPKRHDALKAYVQGVVGHFKDDKRVHVWDVYNEPDNRNNSSYGKFEPANKGDLALALLKKSYGWIREIGPTQPITSGVWVVPNFLDPAKLKPWEKFQLEASDVVTFHAYTKPDETKRCVDALRRYGRPIICTEYMARPQGSAFDPTLEYFKREKVGAYNWGFVAGKSNTIYPWDSWKKPYASEPPVWFHDIFRADGTPYRPEEVAYIKKVTGKSN
jgi:endo-1,4-beta-mannosidase